VRKSIWHRLLRESFHEYDEFCVEAIDWINSLTYQQARAECRAIGLEL
jgi:hypothetical protein